jgi:hypothetical protein
MLTLLLALTTVWTETIRDLFPRVGHFANFLGFPRGDLEVGAGHQEIVAVVAARDLATVGTMTQGLFWCGRKGYSSALRTLFCLFPRRRYLPS